MTACSTSPPVWISAITRWPGLELRHGAGFDGADTLVARPTRRHGIHDVGHGAIVELEIAAADGQVVHTYEHLSAGWDRCWQIDEFQLLGRDELDGFHAPSVKAVPARRPFRLI